MYELYAISARNHVKNLYAIDKKFERKRLTRAKIMWYNFGAANISSCLYMDMLIFVSIKSRYDIHSGLY
jgi:hypothetical protein